MVGKSLDMADGRDEFSFLSIDARFDIYISVRLQAGISRGVDILATNVACSTEVNTLKSRDFENLFFPARSMITEFGQHGN